MTQHSGSFLRGLLNLTLSCPIRDDPTIDEATRLRNRIAELESLVRELRGAYGVFYAISFYFSRSTLTRLASQENHILAGLMPISGMVILPKDGIREQPRTACNSDGAVDRTMY